MSFNDILRKRILAATAGVLSMAATAQAVEVKRTSEGWEGPIGAWNDQVDPLAAYGLDTFSLVPYRRDVDQVLSPDAQIAYEQLVSDLKDKVSLKEGEIYEKTILLNIVYDVVRGALADKEYTSSSEVIKIIFADYLREPDATLAKIIDQFAEIAPPEHDDSAFNEDDAPPETQQGVKVYLEHKQLQLKAIDIQIAEIDKVVGLALNLPKHPKGEQIAEVEKKLKDILAECPSLESAISAYVDAEYGAETRKGFSI